MRVLRILARDSRHQKKAVLMCLLSVVVMGCDGESGEESEETEGLWCNIQCATCDTETSRSNQTPTVENTGAANYGATMTIDWDMCCCNTCWPFPWLDDQEDTLLTTTITWDTGVSTTRPPGAAQTSANSVAAAKLAAATPPACP